MRIEVDDVYITNIPTGKRTPPRGEPFIAYLICHYVTRGHRKRVVESITSWSKRAWRRRILAFASRREVVIRNG